MVNYATSEGFTFNMIILKSFSLCDDCINIEIWEEPSCTEKLNRLIDYKKNLVKFEFVDEYEIKQKDDMVDNLSLMISKLESLKK
jgi:Ran GTPase-activating protein (RanGAP) involved in mRNA processing and transport